MKFLYRKIVIYLRSGSVRNVGYLGAMQLFGLAIPLIATPWVLRALQPTAYGKLVLAIAIVGYGNAVVDFGFNLSATQKVAQIRDDEERLTRYFWTVQSARFILTIIAAGISLIVVVGLPKFHPIMIVTVACLPSLVGTLLYPQWLFLGLERLRAVAVTNILAQMLAVIPLFIFVHTPKDVVSAAFISTLSSVVGGLLSCALIAQSRVIRFFYAPRISEVLSVCSDAWPLFVSQVAVTLYSISNAIVLGLVRDAYQVGIFNAADRVRTYSTFPLMPFVDVFFPRVSGLMANNRTRAIDVLVKLAIVMCAGMACISALLFFGAPTIVEIVMGSGFEAAIPVLQIISILPFIEAINAVFGPIALLTLGLKKELARILAIASVINLVLLVILGKTFGAIGVAISLTITNLLIVAGMAFALACHRFLQEFSTALLIKLRILRP
jgi:O-antigen/teichoic acid export membrane protein